MTVLGVLHGRNSTSGGDDECTELGKPDLENTIASIFGYKDHITYDDSGFIPRLCGKRKRISVRQIKALEDIKFSLGSEGLY